MVGHNGIADKVVEKDRAILAYLEDIKLDLHEKGQGYTLTFVFEKNSYFNGTELKKTFIMSKPNVIEKCVGTSIEWTQGSDPTKEKKKIKKKQKGGGKKTITKEIKCDSFFNFFETIELKEKDKKGKKKEDESDEDENDVGEKMDDDFDLGNDFKDDLIPLALEYYLGVIEQEDGDDDDSDDDKDDDDDSDDDKPKKKKKGKGGGGPKGSGGDAAGAQQECK